jgi:hypothetical protein
MIPRYLGKTFVAFVVLWLLAWAGAGMLPPQRIPAARTPPLGPARTAGVAIAPANWPRAAT